MAGRDWDASIERRRLRAELRSARESAGLTQAQIAEDLYWSHSKIIRIESGSVGISVVDLHALLAKYGVTDHARINELTQMARNSKQRSWLHPYKDTVGAAAASFYAYEESASVVRSYQPTVIPGLLQTEDYADDILQYLRGPKTRRRLDDLVHLRIERQRRILSRDEPPAMSFVLDEAVIRRFVGGPEIMLRQLEHLLTMSQRPNVSIRVVPFTLGFYRSVRVPYVILEFPDPADHHILFLEYPEGDEIIREDEAVSDSDEEAPTAPRTYLEIFWDLERVVELDASRALIEDAMQVAAAATSRPAQRWPAPEDRSDQA